MKSQKILAAFAAIALTACGDDNAVAHDEQLISYSEESSSSSDAAASSSSDATATSSSSAVVPNFSSAQPTSSSVNNGSIITDGKIVDSRDGKIYKTTTIGNQVWMAQNLTLDVSEYLEKGRYPLNVIDDEGYESETLFSTLLAIYQEFDYTYSIEKTNYYHWYVAVDSAGIFSKNASECAKTGDCSKQGFIRGICPEGFHIPDSTEVEQLYKAVGGRCLAGRDLRAENRKWYALIGSNNNLEAASNKYGFSAEPEGYFGYAWWDGHNVPDLATNLPVTFFTNKNLEYWGIDYHNASGAIDGVYHAYINKDLMEAFLPIRCLRDEPAGVDWVDLPTLTAPELPEFEYGEFTDTRDGKTYKTVVVNGKTWMDQNLAYSLTDDDFEEVYKLQGSRPPDEQSYTCEHPLIGTHVSCDHKFKIDSTYCKAHETSCKNYGKFYTWNEANVVCPTGWHLPTAEEIDDFMNSPNPYVIYAGECFSREISFEKLMDQNLSKLLDEDLGKHINFEFWSSTEASHNKDYVITSLSEGLSKGADANVRCVKD